MEMPDMVCPSCGNARDNKLKVACWASPDGASLELCRQPVARDDCEQQARCGACGRIRMASEFMREAGRVKVRSARKRAAVRASGRKERKTMAMEKNGKRSEAAKGDAMRPDKMADDVGRKALEKSASNKQKQQGKKQG